MQLNRYLQAVLIASAAITMLATVPAQTVSKKAVSPWGARYFPNVPLINQDGETVRFFDDLIKDKVVVINFIYTNCPDACPLETSRLLEVQQILGDRVGQDVFMYSITIDPERDTPAVMKEYAKTYQAGPGWSFLTGTSENITLLRRKLGLYIEEIQDGSNNHNLSLIIGNQATGRWMRRSPFENAHVLASQIGSWLHNWKLPAKKKSDYERAPKLRNLSKGESLYRTRCGVCHSIGSAATTARVGPDLMNVSERRDRDWLMRWIKAPDRVLAEKDPIALGLFAAFNRVPMPNMRLTDPEVSLLLEFIEKESSRVAAVQGKDGVAAKGASKTASCCLKKEALVLGASSGRDDQEQIAQSTQKVKFSTVSLLSIIAGCALGSILLFRRLR